MTDSRRAPLSGSPPRACRFAARPLVFSAWAFATGGEQLAAVAENLPSLRLKAGAIAVAAFARPR